MDISVEMCGIKFPNPFGLASAPPATTCGMIRYQTMFTERNRKVEIQKKQNSARQRSRN